MRWRQDRATGKLIEIEPRKHSGAYINRDIEPFISPVDGSLIRTRRDLLEHEKRTGMTNDLDHLREQKNVPVGPSKHERKLAIKDAIERGASSGFHREVGYDE